jgi:hypothetical protein
MVEEGLFPRKRKQASQAPDGIQMDDLSTQSAPICSGTFCSGCGLDHDSTVKIDSPTDPPICPIAHRQMMRLPIMEVTRLLSRSLHARTAEQEYSLPRSRGLTNNWELQRDLVAISDPLFTLAIHHLVSLLKLKTFPSACSETLFPVSNLGPNVAQINNRMAPFALLSIITGILIKRLVRGGLRVADQDFSIYDGRRKTRARLLTPSHIIRGLYTIENRALLSCLLRLGLPLNLVAGFGAVGTEIIASEE